MHKHKQLLIPLLFLLVILASCSGDENTASEKTNDNNVVESNEQENTEHNDSNLDPDDEMTPFIKQGEALLDGTDQMDGEASKNELSCLSCHANDSDTSGISLVGVTSQYPKYDERKDAVITIEEKINDSISHDLNGEPLDYDGEEMRSIVAYLTFISQGEDYEEHKEENINKDISELDLDNGKKIYDEKIKDSTPVLFGEGSFTDSSYMSRLSIMANYVKNYLPQNNSESLSEQEAVDVAGYVLSKDRPKWRGDDTIWSNDGKPADLINKKERTAIENGSFDWSVVNDS